jgi:hypothetical protein
MPEPDGEALESGGTLAWDTGNAVCRGCNFRAGAVVTAKGWVDFVLSNSVLDGITPPKGIGFGLMVSLHRQHLNWFAMYRLSLAASRSATVNRSQTEIGRIETMLLVRTPSLSYDLKI